MNKAEMITEILNLYDRVDEAEKFVSSEGGTEVLPPFFELFYEIGKKALFKETLSYWHSVKSHVETTERFPSRHSTVSSRRPSIWRRFLAGFQSTTTRRCSRSKSKSFTLLNEKRQLGSSRKRTK